LTLHEVFRPGHYTPPFGSWRSGGNLAAGIDDRPAACSRGILFFIFNPDLSGARRIGRAFVPIRTRGPRRLFGGGTRAEYYQ